MLVRVAIDLALDRLFDYEVPKELEKKLAVGQLLSVPFGHRTARGFVMELGDEGSGVSASATLKDANRHYQDPKRPYSLKPIEAIVDEEPFFSTRLLELVGALAG